MKAVGRTQAKRTSMCSSMGCSFTVFNLNAVVDKRDMQEREAHPCPMGSACAFSDGFIDVPQLLTLVCSWNKEIVAAFCDEMTDRCDLRGEDGVAR